MTRLTAVCAFAAVALGLVLGEARAAGEEDAGAWPDIRAALFGDRPIADGAGLIRLEAPARAYDAAIVPISVVAEIPQTPGRFIRTVHLVIDNNPSPVAGVFGFAADGGSASFATRVRINEYTFMRAIAETNDGALYMAARFVKAAGGCSAPSLKDQAKAMAQLGRLKLKHTGAIALNKPVEAQLLISHPNFSGLQFDQISRNYIPPQFVQRIVVRFGARTVLEVDADISLSEDPSIHFTYVPDGPGALGVEVTDSDGNRFEQSWPVEPAPSS